LDLLSKLTHCEARSKLRRTGRKTMFDALSVVPPTNPPRVPDLAPAINPLAWAGSAHFVQNGKRHTHDARRARWGDDDCQRGPLGFR